MRQNLSSSAPVGPFNAFDQMKFTRAVNSNKHLEITIDCLQYCSINMKYQNVISFKLWRPSLSSDTSKGAKRHAVSGTEAATTLPAAQ
jgi:hypothetical protein